MVDMQRSERCACKGLGVRVSPWALAMKELLLQLLIITYASVSVIGIVAYWPTIKDLYRKKPSANINSYILWTVGSGIGFLYSLFILSDLLLRIVSGLYLGANALVLLLAIKLRHR